MYCILANVLMMAMLHVETNVKLTSCLRSVARIQTDIDLHDGHMLDLNLQPKTGLEQNVKARSLEDVDVTCE